MLEQVHSPCSSRALVVIEASPKAAPSHRPIGRTAAFVAQLIANAGRAPQARERRRAEPAEVIAAYRAAIERLQNLDCESE